MAVFSTVKMVICQVCGTHLAYTLVQGYYGHYTCEPCLQKSKEGGF